MSSQRRAIGLGIDARPPAPMSSSESSDYEVPSLASQQRVPRRTLTGPRAPPRPLARRMTIIESSTNATIDSVLRSSRYMQDLSRAEAGESMVEFNKGGLGAQTGSRFALDPMTPRGSTLPRPGGKALIVEDRSLKGTASSIPRDVTLLSFGGSDARSAAELKSLLGNSNARLKSGASILPEHARYVHDKKVRKEQAVALEQAKSRARVEVDIVLESDVCVQGGYARGHIKVCVRKRSKKEEPLLLAEGKIRIVGYEFLNSEDERFTFYQCAAPFSAVTDASRGLYQCDPDAQGFAQAVEGVHVLPFALHLPPDNSFGTPKGVLSIGSSVTVRYIAMVSVKVKDPVSGRRSIAHFYRHCEVWPYLNPTTTLQPAPRPLLASTAKGLSILGGSKKVKLDAHMHRLYWPAGSRCPVSIHVDNASKKTIRSASLALVRTIIIFRPRPILDIGSDKDPDACQTATTHKVVSESCLEMCAGVSKGHASAKGWWTGVKPGQELDFVHYVAIPSEALSVTRGRLLEVEYSIRVTLGAGPLSPDISVTLPIRIFNFISIDPPPSAGLISSTGAYIRPSHSMALSQELPTSNTADMMLKLPAPLSVMQEDDETDIMPLVPCRTGSLRVTNPDVETEDFAPRTPLVRIASDASETSVYSSASSADLADTDAPQDTQHMHVLGNLELEDDAGSDDEVKAVLNAVKPNTRHFVPSTSQDHDPLPISSKPRVRRPSADPKTPRMEGVGAGRVRRSFAARVEEKTRALAAARLPDSISSTRPKRAAGVSGFSYVSAYAADSSSAGEDEPTPRIGCSQHQRRPMSPLATSDGSTAFERGQSRDASDSDDGGHLFLGGNTPRASTLSARLSRQLPRPPPMTSQSSDTEADLAYAELPKARPPLPAVVIPSSTGSRILPTPPAIPKTPCDSPTRRTTYLPSPSRAAAAGPPRFTHPATRDALRQEIIRPPRSPLRPLADTRVSHTAAASTGGVKGRIAALEVKVRGVESAGDAYC